MVPHAASIIAWARAQMGVHEVPASSNDGPELRHMLKDTNFEPGDRWCMFFAEAALKAGFPEGHVIPAWITHTGSCAMQGDKARKAGELSAFAATGAIVLFAAKDGVFHHCGIVTEIDDANHRIKSIQGNTNGVGSFNGGEVAEHWNKSRNAMFVVW